jgi:hypothetical protein
MGPLQTPAALRHHDLDVAVAARVVVGDDVAAPGIVLPD